jgi:hypothetical protein
MCYTVSRVLLMTLMTEAVITSGSSVSVQQTTRCNISEDNHLHTRLCDNLRSHLM